MIQVAVIIQHVKGMKSRPLVALIGNETKTAIERGNHVAHLLKAGCIQCPGVDKMLCRTGQEESWEDDLEVVVLDVE